MNTADSLASIKTPATRYPVNELLLKRWSARAFSDQPITPDTLNTLFEAASWAASSMNEQPWIYLYAHRQDTENFQRFHDCLMPGNQLWAQNAAVLVLSLARKNFLGNGKPNRHSLHDVGAANTTLLLQAAHEDIYGHMMGGFDMARTIETFHLPENIEPACFIALGHLSHPDTLDEPFRSRELAPRSRKSLDEIVFENKLP
jgi:nitroreductase